MVEIQLSSRAEFEKSIEKGVGLVDFNAPWCAPCRAMEPVIGKLADAYEGRAFILKVNIDENLEIALHLGIQSIPTIIIFKEGIERSRFVGLQGADTLGRALENVMA